METVFTSNGNFRTIDLNESDIHAAAAADGFDIKNFLPKELTAHDQVRLKLVLLSSFLTPPFRSHCIPFAVRNDFNKFIADKLQI